MLLLTYYPIPLDHFVHMVLFFHCAAADDDNDNYDDDDPVLHHKVRGRDWMLWQNTPSSGGGKKQLLVPILATTWSFLMDSFLKKAFWGDVSTRRKNMTSTFFKKKQKTNKKQKRINSTDYLVAKDKIKETPMLSEVAQNFLSEIKGGKKEEAVRHT